MPSVYQGVFHLSSFAIPSRHMGRCVRTPWSRGIPAAQRMASFTLQVGSQGARTCCMFLSTVLFFSSTPSFQSRYRSCPSELPQLHVSESPRPLDPSQAFAALQLEKSLKLYYCSYDITVFLKPRPHPTLLLGIKTTFLKNVRKQGPQSRVDLASAISQASLHSLASAPCLQRHPAPSHPRAFEHVLSIAWNPVPFFNGKLKHPFFTMPTSH